MELFERKGHVSLISICYTSNTVHDTQKVLNTILNEWMNLFMEGMDIKHWFKIIQNQWSFRSDGNEPQSLRDFPVYGSHLSVDGIP